MQALLLAGPGVVIGTILVSIFAKFVFPYGWCWPKALLFGAMLSATDPVAVVALLKEVGEYTARLNWQGKSNLHCTVVLHVHSFCLYSTALQRFPGLLLICTMRKYSAKFSASEEMKCSGDL